MKKTPDAAVATPDDKIMKMLADVELQKAAIACAEKPHYKTNRTWSYTEGAANHITNLAVEKSVAVLTKIAAFVHGASRDYYEVAHMSTGLGLGQGEVPAFLWNNYSAEDWVHDIRIRVSQLRLQAQRDKLQDLEARLAKIVSPAKRQELELAAIERELGAS